MKISYLRVVISIILIAGPLVLLFIIPVARGISIKSAFCFDLIYYLTAAAIFVVFYWRQPFLEKIKIALLWPVTLWNLIN